MLRLWSVWGQAQPEGRQLVPTTCNSSQVGVCCCLAVVLSPGVGLACGGLTPAHRKGSRAQGTQPLIHGPLQANF